MKCIWGDPYYSDQATPEQLQEWQEKWSCKEEATNSGIGYCHKHEKFTKQINEWLLSTEI